MRASKVARWTAGSVSMLGLVGTLGMAIMARLVTRPDNLGVENGQLAPCPNTPNCVSTQLAPPEQHMAPIPFSGSAEEAQDRIRAILEEMPRTEIIEDEDGYIAAVVRSQMFAFPDDVEFVINDDLKVIHFRSASRLGRGDMGVNRKRMEDFREAFLNSSSVGA